MLATIPTDFFDAIAPMVKMVKSWFLQYLLYTPHNATRLTLVLSTMLTPLMLQWLENPPVPQCSAFLLRWPTPRATFPRRLHGFPMSTCGKLLYSNYTTYINNKATIGDPTDLKSTKRSNKDLILESLRKFLDSFTAQTCYSLPCVSVLWCLHLLRRSYTIPLWSLARTTF